MSIFEEKKEEFRIGQFDDQKEEVKEELTMIQIEFLTLLCSLDTKFITKENCLTTKKSIIISLLVSSRHSSICLKDMLSLQSISNITKHV
ncbi:13207_t:CDS:2, partial [Entrophospora sp. SA101]